MNSAAGRWEGQRLGGAQAVLGLSVLLPRAVTQPRGPVLFGLDFFSPNIFISNMGTQPPSSSTLLVVLP